MDPLAGSAWSETTTVAGFTTSPPNATLMQFAEQELQRRHSLDVLDIGSGAGRNAVPIAQLGCRVLGIDLSWPMLGSAAQRRQADQPRGRLDLALSPMEQLPVRSGAFDLVIAHGVWNLARSAMEFRLAVREAARAARPGASLFVFTFSRNTLPAGAQPLAGEPFVFTQFSGQPQTFLTDSQLIAELGAAGFIPDPAVPLREHNRPRPGGLPTPKVPVIYEGVFRRTA